MIKYPMSFTCSAASESGMQTKFQATAEDFPAIGCAIPTQFGGPGGGYSPEDLFALSVISCLVATFKVLAERGKLTYSTIESDVTLTIDRNASGVVGIQKLDIDITLKGVQDEAKAKTLLSESKKYCLVSNAVSCEKQINYSILTE